MFLELLERRLLFRPRPLCDATPADLGLDYETTLIDTADGRSLLCWYIPGHRPTDLTWLWFGGVGANLSLRVGEFAAVREHTGGNILAFDYGGFGLSEGRPSVRNTAIDARAALAQLHRRYDVSPESVHYLGVSMGAAVAIRLAAETRSPRGLALVAPFASLRDMARMFYPAWTLGGWLVGQRFDSVAYIGRIGCPLIILHGTDDTLVPVSQGRALYDAAAPPKQFAELDGAGHLDIGDHPGFWRALCAWTDGLATPAGV